jgi:hypothetical protein
VLKVGLEDEAEKKKTKKTARSDRRDAAKTQFESSYPGSLWGSDRVAPSDESLELCTWEKGEPPEWHHWSLFLSVDEVEKREAAKREKKESEKSKDRKRKHQEDDSEDEGTTGLKFGGGLWKAQTVCELRRKVVAGKGLVHLEALATYDQGLFDAALREPPEGFRLPSTQEVMRADKAAWAEVARLVKTKAATAEAAFAHVAKPGGFLWGLIRPEEKRSSVKSAAAGPTSGLHVFCAVLPRTLSTDCSCSGAAAGATWRDYKPSWKDAWNGNSAWKGKENKGKGLRS